MVEAAGVAPALPPCEGSGLLLILCPHGEAAAWTAPCLGVPDQHTASPKIGSGSLSRTGSNRLMRPVEARPSDPHCNFWWSHGESNPDFHDAIVASSLLTMAPWCRPAESNRVLSVFSRTYAPAIRERLVREMPNTEVKEVFRIQTLEEFDHRIIHVDLIGMLGWGAGIRTPIFRFRD